MASHLSITNNLTIGLLISPASLQNYRKNHSKKALRMRDNINLLLQTATLVFYSLLIYFGFRYNLTIKRRNRCRHDCINSGI